ncbi:septum formation protein Maf [Olivibacter sp. SDN3]|uniref:Maf family nucleotide pyrophosphatase n=1 Tax=Olivibacter sp. SDN3 TaxID=2764720 RepID=UPI001651125A|nr:Maf family nucleotide pyrophosphatase [Olivibacter sp. SDN3]QNL48422.1 septum formation protein Maf [Olivibacter sp. SDN3]
MEDLSQKTIILASKSPRRKELLSALGLTFKTDVKEVDESYPDTMNGAAVALYIAGKKAEAFDVVYDNELVITADTIVCVDDLILGKPKDYDEAFQMLTRLSGKRHEVITGVALKTRDRIRTFHEVTAVYFNQLNDEQIKYYIENFEPYDKAGAYGIQEWIGAVAVRHIDGSYTNVMGLPTAKLYNELIKLL